MPSAGQRDARGQGPDLAEADRGVARRRDGEGPRRVLGERRRRSRGERPAPSAVTVRVKDWVAVLELASVAVMVIG